LCATSPARAAAPAAIGPADAASAGNLTDPLFGYPPDTEIVVKNWVLCASAAVAEQLVRAREESVDRAVSAYAKLSQTRACGQFVELRVILRERLYVSATAGADSGVYGALVNISGDWASGFVVYGGLPTD
jgi:hypothetical protein